MNITVNGKVQQVDDETSIGRLLEKLNLDPARVAVEHNLAVVALDDFEETTIAEGDTLEIVQFVGGG